MGSSESSLLHDVMLTAAHITIAVINRLKNFFISFFFDLIVELMRLGFTISWLSSIIGRKDKKKSEYKLCKTSISRKNSLKKTFCTAEHLILRYADASC